MFRRPRLRQFGPWEPPYEEWAETPEQIWLKKNWMWIIGGIIALTMLRGK